MAARAPVITSRLYSGQLERGSDKKDKLPSPLRRLLGSYISLWLKLGHLTTPSEGEAREYRLVAEWQCASPNVQFLLLQKRQENIERRLAQLLDSLVFIQKSEL